MIKINTDAFDWDEINKIYRDDSNELIDPLKNNINEKYLDPGTHRIIKGLLDRWFFYNGIISKRKISEYLMCKDFTQFITEFDAAILEVLPVPDREFATVITSWRTAKQSACQHKQNQERKAIITSVITPQNIHLFAGISLDELNTEPVRGSIFSNRERIKKITLRCEPELEMIREELSKIFNYKTIIPKFRDRLLSAMHIEVCPYCNRQYITIFKDDDIFRSTADIDHFYSQDQYPFLALSLYNFVPSCQICNSRFKHTVDFGHINHINPYEEGFDDIGIFRLKNIDCLLGNSPNCEFEIINKHNDQKIANSIATFHLEEIYKSHEDYVCEIIKKAKIYSDGQLDEYLKQFGDLFENESEVRRTIFGNYIQESELGKRPLAKLTMDILKDLGVKMEKSK